jgi:hypothetical protein
MKHKIITAIALLALCLTTIIIITTQTGRTELVSASEFEISDRSTSFSSIPPGNPVLPTSTTCALKPQINRTTPSSLTPGTLGQVTLDRFRRTYNSPLIFPSARVGYTPKESIALANPTNFGDRFIYDLYGRPAYHYPIVVLHETVGSARGTINFFQTPHPLEADQVSYHTLIKRDGEIVYVVPPDKRAFGAGDSVFVGDSGQEAVKTNPDYPPSVNNFAYHISLETPSDGNDNGSRHSGYTLAQYQSLAWLVAKTGVPYSRITTHKAVDRSGQRKDPRSFDNSTFVRLLQAQPQTQEIIIGCQPPSY